MRTREPRERGPNGEIGRSLSRIEHPTRGVPRSVDAAVNTRPRPVTAPTLLRRTPGPDRSPVPTGY